MFISDALSRGLNIKWVAEYCGTSVAMIEKHYGCYIKSDSQEQLRRLFAVKTETFTETPRTGSESGTTQVVKRFGGKKWSGRVDLNHEEQKPAERLKPPRLVAMRKKP